ncbi:MAG: hypothetical protein FVQ77_17440, partial [Cytophagales bacterium]|nr:hypothetical protein [Cytophagales bacterium]
AVNTGLTSTNVYSLAISGTNIFAGTGGGVFLSTNNGSSWTAVNTGLTDLNVRSLAISGTNIFAGTWRGGVWKRPLSEMCIGVSITNILSNQSATVGGTVTWSVSTSGSSPFTYQWYKNGSPITGATDSSYTTPTLTLSDSGSAYYCYVTNCSGSNATSNIAALTVVTTTGIKNIDFINNINIFPNPTPGKFTLEV